MSCDICGGNKRTFLTSIEGARLYVCVECNPKGEGKVERKEFVKRQFNNNNSNNNTGGSKVKNVNSNFSNEKKKFNKPKRVVETNLDLLDNYGQIIKKYRESNNLTIEDMARRIRVSSSFLNKVESGKFKPDSMLINKLFESFAIILTKNNEENDILETDVKEEVVNKHIEPFSEISFNGKKRLIL